VGPPEQPRASLRDGPVGFVGRRWVLDRVANWLGGSSPILVITGLAGTGKSALASRLVELADPSGGASAVSTALSSALAAVHFCRASSDVSLDPAWFAPLVSAQLADRLPAFAAARDEELSAQMAEPVTIRGTAIAEVVAQGSWNVGALVTLTELSAKQLADRLLRRPAQHVAGEGPTPVVLVDALDESIGYYAAVGLIEVLVSLVPNAALRWLVTTRPDPRVLNALPDHAERLDLLEDCPVGVDDVADYAQARMATLSGASNAQVYAARVAKAARGNFLYARHVLDSLLVDPDRLTAVLTDPDAAALPADLADVYRQFLNRELRRTATPDASHAWRHIYRPLLATLAAAFDPGLTAHQLSVLLGIGGLSEVRDALDSCAQLLDPPSDPDGPWRCYHESFRRYLLYSKDRIDEPGDIHWRIAEALVSEWDGAWDNADDYSLGHAVGHHIAAMGAPDMPRRRRRELARRRAELQSLLGDLEFLEAKTARFGIDATLSDIDRSLRWQEARHETVEPTQPLPRNSERIPGIGRILEREAHHLRRWDPGKEAALFSQQVHNRALELRLEDVAASARRRLSDRNEPFIQLQWRRGPNSAPLLRTLTGERSKGMDDSEEQGLAWAVQVTNDGNVIWVRLS